jgi:hypothetical protein
VSGVLHCGDIGVFVQVFTSTFTARDSSVMRSASLVVCGFRLKSITHFG